VMVGVITLYQDWLPFGLALGYVVVHHTVLGLVTPTDVVNHPAALRAPWKWALIHGASCSRPASPPWSTGGSANTRRSRSTGWKGWPGPTRSPACPTGASGRRSCPGSGPAVPAPRCLAMIDLDDFKAYNDRFGHQAGDLVLKEAATAWRGEVRSTDLLARYGGEEFVLLLPACALDDAIRIVERLRVVTPWSPARSGWPAGFPGGRGRADPAGRSGPVHGQGRGPQPPRPGLLIPTTPEPDPPLAGPPVGA
jgi:diguanylate cyclase